MNDYNNCIVTISRFQINPAALRLLPPFSETGCYSVSTTESPLVCWCSVMETQSTRRAPSSPSPHTNSLVARTALPWPQHDIWAPAELSPAVHLGFPHTMAGGHFAALLRRLSSQWTETVTVDTGMWAYGCFGLHADLKYEPMTVFLWTFTAKPLQECPPRFCVSHCL